MSKRILILSSTPRKGGNSDVLCDEFARGAKEAGNEVAKIRLAEKNVGYCTGCSVCSMYGKPCPIKDDAPAIVQQMIDSDIIVLATPVYFYTMSAQLKTFIDRCCARYTEISNKEFYFIITAADNDKANLERTADALRGFTICLEGAEERGVIYGTGAWKIGEIKQSKAMKEAYEAGKTV